MSRRPETSTNTAEIIACALEQLVYALEGQHAGPILRNRASMNDYLRHNPSKFNGRETPDEADDWICNNEKIFEVIDSSEEQKLVFSTFMLAGEAEYWWRGMRQLMNAEGEKINWVNFRTRFLERYFPESAKYEREAEFLTLQQGGRTVQEYVARFEYLARFYTHTISEELKCRKFERGLRHIS